MTGLFRRAEPTGVWWRDHSLSLVIGGILAAQLAYSILSGHQEWASQQVDHGAPAGWGPGFWWWWTYETTMSTLADTYGVLLIVLLSKWLVERGSAESN